MRCVYFWNFCIGEIFVVGVLCFVMEFLVDDLGVFVCEGIGM